MLGLAFLAGLFGLQIKTEMMRLKLAVNVAEFQPQHAPTELLAVTPARLAPLRVQNALWARARSRILLG